MVEKLRLGVAGTGAVVEQIYQWLYYRSMYSSRLSVEAIADPNAKSLNAFGDRYGIPKERRFNTHKEMLEAAKAGRFTLDVVCVNTPDSFHKPIAVDALKAGCDVFIPKPFADKLIDAYEMMLLAEKLKKIIVVDYHKRDDPRFQEVRGRYLQGQYGKFQTAHVDMLDRIDVATPGKFFSSPNFAEKNTPASFLFVHMGDALMYMVGLRPVSLKAIGYKQKLPTLKPIPVNGYDMIITEMLFENGATAFIRTGWHLPSSAWAMTVQEARMIFTDGLVDIKLDEAIDEISTPHKDASGTERPGFERLNPLFKTSETDDRGNIANVRGYGIDNPGKLLMRILQSLNEPDKRESIRKDLMDPLKLGFYTTLTLEGIDVSLKNGKEQAKGVIVGADVDLDELVIKDLGSKEAAKPFLIKK